MYAKNKVFEHFIKSEPWKKAHVLWFKRAAEELEDSKVKEYADKDDYFKYVDKVMQRLHPHKMFERQRTAKARSIYFEYVCSIISKQPNKFVNKDVVEYFKSLKNNYRLALITTNTRESIDKIFSYTKLEGLFNLIELSYEDEKDDKTVVFDRFIRNYGKPVVYIGGDRKDSFEYCMDNSIPCIFANLEGDEGSDYAETVHTLEELKKSLEEKGINNE
ncbi:hypothetical protein AYK26_05470 [Euryarchaeota archaeon SM23-78]|nr:MAG: hypothetical protein AYK26_05470 [Euryarchaeota archaeon SM23-78]